MYLMVIFLCIIFLGYPVGFALFLMPTAYILLTAKYPLTIVPCMMYEAINYFNLIAIPLFIFAGTLLNAIGLIGGLVAFSQQLVGRIRGGLAHMNIVVSLLFGGINGSIVADTAMVGSLLIPAMKKEGYSASFSAAVTAASSSLAVIIPPSIAMIIYATIVGTSIGALFIGGIFPGILICLLQMAAALIVSMRRKYPKYELPFRLKDFVLSFINASPAIICALIIVFGMRGGAFTATEAASVICAYALVLGFVWYRNLTIRKVLECAFEALKICGVLLLIIGAAGPFMWLLSREGMIADMVESMRILTPSPGLTYAFIVGFFLVAGMVMEGTANLLVLGPILAQIGANAGCDPFVVAFAIIISGATGPVTPPVGIALYTAMAISGAKIKDISVDLIPFIIADLMAITIIIAFPIIIKFLPNLLGYVV